MRHHKYILEITVFVCGAIVMIFELTGTRILAPYFGSSIFIWTSLIGVILGSLSLGYYLGGKIVDTKADFQGLAIIIFCAAITIGVTTIIKDPLLLYLKSYFSGIRLISVITAVVLFLPASVLLGMVSPYSAKLKLENIATAGAIIGNLYAIATIGSIAGTFLAGFFLIPHFGTNKVLILLSITLILLSLVLFLKYLKKIRIVSLVIFVIMFAGVSGFNYLLSYANFVDIDTAYNRIWIFQIEDYSENTQKTIRAMQIGNGNHSAMFLDSDELVNEYTKYYHLAKYFNPDFQDTLMIGGAGYSFPKDFLLQYPDANIDVVEIDPKVTELAKKYFKLQDNPRLNIFHEDGRVFLNETKNKYDVIFGDAFSSEHSIPFQLTTREAIQKKYDSLNENGVVILNMISSLDGHNSQFLKAEYATYRDIFPQVFLFPVNSVNDAYTKQNIILVAIKSEKEFNFKSDNTQINEYLQHLWKEKVILDKPVLTDDYAPVEFYTN